MNTSDINSRQKPATHKIIAGSEILNSVVKSAVANLKRDKPVEPNDNVIVNDNFWWLPLSQNGKDNKKNIKQ